MHILVDIGINYSLSDYGHKRGEVQSIDDECFFLFIYFSKVA